MGKLILGLCVFLGTHSVRIFAPRLREAGIERMSDTGWKILYTVVSIFGLYLVGAGFGQFKPDAPIIYETPFWFSHITALLMLFSFIMVVASNFRSGHIKAKLKHPLLMGVKTWAVAHLLINGDLASIVLFGSILAWCVFALVAIKKRGGEPPIAGSIVPDVISVIAGIILWGVFAYWLHTWLIGVPAIA